jgi:hypothetical protein
MPAIRNRTLQKRKADLRWRTLPVEKLNAFADNLANIDRVSGANWMPGALFAKQLHSGVWHRFT